MRSNLTAVQDNGDKHQIARVSYETALASQAEGELGDILGGRKTNQEHHAITDLVNGVVTNITNIHKLRKELDEYNSF